MNQITNLREFLYPAEWCIRFAVISLLLKITDSIYPGQVLLYVIYYAVIIGIFFGFVLQLTYVWDWLKERDKESL
ncbi:MAG: hypothetical protein PHV39_03045 [Methanomicrobium sp.]|nr:hypothetical protein [Methanomicrobium sp.]